MKRNNLIILCVGIFLFVTVFALSLDNTASNRVKISSRDISLSNQGTGVVGDNKELKVNFEKSNVTNKQINAKANNININTSSNISKSDISYNNSDVDYNNQDSKFSTHNNINYKNIDTTEVDTALKAANNIKNQKIENEPPARRYMYKNIDWKTWKSNFVNKILDDSLSIHELDNYSEGDWLSYSFDVDYRGKITNISVKSFVLTEADKYKVMKLIKSYEGTDITVFPANTKKRKANVFAVIMLSDTTKKSKPKDFNDFERVKLQY